MDRQELERLQDRVAWLRRTIEEGEGLIAKESMLAPFVRRYELAIFVLLACVIVAFVGGRALGMTIASRTPCPAIQYELASASITVERHGHVTRLDGDGTLTSTAAPGCTPTRAGVDPATVRDVVDRLARSCFFDMPDAVRDHSITTTTTVVLGPRRHSVTHEAFNTRDSCIAELSHVEQQIGSLVP